MRDLAGMGLTGAGGYAKVSGLGSLPVASKRPLPPTPGKGRFSWRVVLGSRTVTPKTSRRASRKFTRRPPDKTEQARRQAWGREWGPRVGQSIRDYLKENAR